MIIMKKILLIFKINLLLDMLKKEFRDFMINLKPKSKLYKNEKISIIIQYLIIKEL